MSRFVLTCCSTADMNYEYFKKRHIPVVKFKFIINGKKYIDDFGKSISYNSFYQSMREGLIPSTTPPHNNDFRKLWEPFLKEGKDILHITLSSGISKVINYAMIAKTALEDEYPNCKIIVADSLGASSGYGMLVDYAADMRDNNRSAREVYDWIINNRLTINHWFFSTDLTSYLRGGRISRPEYYIGSIVGFCPLMHVNCYGNLIPVTKYNTKQRVINEMFFRMKEYVDNGKFYDGKCYISHSDAKNDAEEIRNLIEKEWPQLKGKVLINSVGSVIGSYTGPGTVALFFKGNKRLE